MTLSWMARGVAGELAAAANSAGSYVQHYPGDGAAFSSAVAAALDESGIAFLRRVLGESPPLTVRTTVGKAGPLALAAADPHRDRIDLVCSRTGRSGEVKVVTGTPGSGEAPPVPDGYERVATVSVTASKGREA